MTKGKYEEARFPEMKRAFCLGAFGVRAGLLERGDEAGPVGSGHGQVLVAASPRSAWEQDDSLWGDCDVALAAEMRRATT
jgi:hypothetical protein